jgi:hypothetical protein
MLQQRQNVYLVVHYCIPAAAVGTHTPQSLHWPILLAGLFEWGVGCDQHWQHCHEQKKQDPDQLCR